MSDSILRLLGPASFQGVEFPVSAIKDSLGHHLVEHVAHGADGADLELTQRRPLRGSIEVPLFDDERITRRYGNPLDIDNRLRAAIVGSPIGRLRCPALGTFTAGIGEVNRGIDAKQQNGWMLELSWVEHNASASVVIRDMALEGEPAVQINSAAADADREMKLIDPSHAFGWLDVLPAIADALDTLNSAIRRPAEIDAALRAMDGAFAENLAAFVSADAYRAIAALESGRSAVLGARRRYLARERATRYFTPCAMSVWEIAQEVYADASRYDRILDANALPDPLVVPASTVILVPPLDG